MARSASAADEPRASRLWDRPLAGILAPRVTSHPLNAVCPYYTMYPLDFPLRVLRGVEKKTWVLDPFCGRGTTNFAARLRGLPSVGIDSSPVAHALSLAKTVHARPSDVVRVATRILDEEEDAPVPQGAFWRLAYHRGVLADLVRLRAALLRDCSTPSRVLLRAIIMGALHGPRGKKRISYLSNQSPRTFAPKPKYAVRFWRERGDRPPEVDVLDVIRDRARRALSEPLDATPAIVRLADAREESAFEGLPKVRLVVTSPPYYGMRTYLPDQWLRRWFLGGPAEVEYGGPPDQMDHASPDRFSEQLRDVWANVATRSRRDAKLIVRFGGIHDRKAAPLDVLKDSFRDSGWRLSTLVSAGTADLGRRQAIHFQSEDDRNEPMEEFDAYAVRE